MRNFKVYIKHQFSRLQDQSIDVHLDDESHIATLTCGTFDSHLVSELITNVMPTKYGVYAYSADDRDGVPTTQKYQLRIQIGGECGVLFHAKAVKLAKALFPTSTPPLAITLSVAAR
ncbi:hypothetical protein [Propionivibrio sp.]|uniref:hypothetical protein n=1 Tax=Propionivibrio sp. TaxID=2212460 RepID=UPI003BF1D4DA